MPCQGKAQIEATGFIRNYNAVQTTPEHEILVGRNRFRLDMSRSFSAGQIQISNEVQNFYTDGVDSLDFRLREAYADLYFTNSDLRVGKQIISWGRTDGAFIADILSPVNLSEFLTQDFSDIRTGLSAISYTHYFGSNYLQFIVNPVFHPNVTPRPGSRWFPRTFFDGNTQTQLRPYEPEPSLRNAQFGGRFAFRSNLNYDLDLGVLYWHYPNPSYSKNFEANLFEEGVLQLTETFTQSLVVMYSGTLQLGDRLFLKSEASYYTKRSFDYLSEDLRNFDITNPSFLERLQLAQIFENNTDGFLEERPWLIGMFRTGLYPG
ncbi:MAG: DUF1302 family protein [Balneolaceae bacterium]|nr:DUF1302 family protein [Balneolaceae bacterium]